MNNNIKEIIYKLNKVIVNFENYYKIVNDTINNYNISNRNYEILKNIKEINNNNIINEIDKRSSLGSIKMEDFNNIFFIFNNIFIDIGSNTRSIILI